MSHEQTEETGRPLLISFAELRGIHTNLATLNAKLDNISTLPAKLDELEKRVIVLEQDKAVRTARSGLYDKALAALGALALVVIGAGAGAWLPSLFHTTP